MKTKDMLETTNMERAIELLRQAYQALNDAGEPLFASRISSMATEIAMVVDAMIVAKESSDRR